MLWQSNLKLALENIDVLKTQFTEEIKTFEGYIEHISKLSDERETLALEYEATNKELNEKIEQLSQQLASWYLCQRM